MEREYKNGRFKEDYDRVMKSAEERDESKIFRKIANFGLKKKKEKRGSLGDKEGEKEKKGRSKKKKAFLSVRESQTERGR